MGEVVTVMGAGGKMGCRITETLLDQEYKLRCVEPDSAGRDRLAERGVEVHSAEKALPGSDVVVMAVPDELMGEITAEIVPDLDSGTIVVLLDPAAAYAEVLPDREDITYFLTHPCHPSFFTAKTSIDDENPDWFGGQGRDPQPIVCALHQGPETDYHRAKHLARDIYAPVTDAHRVTTEQMAILEPALSETLAATCIDVIHEGMETAVEMGVPEAAARDFLFGHLRISLGIIFGYTDFPFSDGARHAIERAKEDIFTDDWKETVFDRENIKESTKDIATSE